MKTMKGMEYLLFLVLFAGCSKIKSGDWDNVSNYYVHDLLIIAGESNPKGGALNTTMTAYEKSIRPNMKIFDTLNFVFNSMDIGANNDGSDSNHHGFENGIGLLVDQHKLCDTLYFVKQGRGGAKVLDFSAGTYYWDRFCLQVDSAIAKTQLLNHGARPKLFLLWSQGINDLIHDMNATDWKANTRELLERMRSRYGTLPIFITRLPQPAYNGYNTQITEICAEMNECYAISSDGAMVQNPAHWGIGGLKTMASNFVDIFNAHYTMH